MHILVIPSWYSNDDLDISGSFFKEQAEAIKELGHQVTIAYVETRSARKILNDSVHRSWKPGFIYSEKGLTEYRWRIYNWLLKLPYGKEFLVKRKLKKMVSMIQRQENKVDVVHLHSFLSHGFGVDKIFRNTEIPVIITEHYSGFPRGDLKPYQKNIVRNLLKRANRIIVVGPGLKDSLSSFTNKNIEIIPNMVDISLYKNLKERENSSNYFRFVSIGNLNFRKGLDLQIRAAAILLNENIHFELTIVGEGSFRKELEFLISELKLENHVKLNGKAQRNEIPEILNNCDAFVLTSRNEPFGVVLIEAMAAGKPVIATNNAGPSSIVSTETGLLIENENVDAIAKAMMYMIENLGNYSSDNIKNYCENKFGKEAVISQISSVYKDVLPVQGK